MAKAAWILVGGGLIAIVFYELLAVAQHWTTISQWVWGASAQPAVPFLFGLGFGVLFGHFFFPQRRRDETT